MQQNLEKGTAIYIYTHIEVKLVYAREEYHMSFISFKSLRIWNHFTFETI